MAKPTYEELAKRVELLEKEQKIRNDLDDLSQDELKNDIQRLDYLSRVAQKQNQISESRRLEAELFEKVQKLREEALVQVDKSLPKQEQEKQIAEQLANTLGITIERLRQIEKNGKKAADQLERFSGIMSEGEELGDQFFGGIAAHLGIAESKLGLFIDKINELDPEGMEEFAAQFSKYFNSMNIGMSILSKIAEMTLKYALAVDEATAAFAANTGAGRALTSEIGAVGSQFRNLGITAKEAGEAAEALFSKFPGFLNQTKAVKEEMMALVAGLDMIGVSTDTSTENIMFFNKNLGMTGDQAANVTKNIAMTGKALGMTAEDVLKDFNASLKVLAVYGDKSLTIFTNLATQAKAAGVEMESLLGLASKFDTFSDAAETTGKLNALLGTQLSTLELLTMTEDERIEAIISSIQAQGRQFKELGRFEQKAIAAAVGIDDLNEAQRIFGMNLGQYREHAREVDLAAEKQKEFEQAQKDAMTVLKKLEMLMMEFAINLGPIVDSLGSIIQFFLDIFSMGNGFVIKLGLIGMGFFLIRKALSPLKGLLTFFTTVGLPKFGASLGTTSSTLAGMTPQLSAAGVGMATFGGGLMAILGPVALVVGAFALLAFAIGYAFSSIAEGTENIANMAAGMGLLSSVLGTIGTVGLLSSFGFKAVTSGLKNIRKEVNLMDLDKLKNLSPVMTAITSEPPENETAAEVGFAAVGDFIDELSSPSAASIEPMLENLALITTGTSAQAMNAGTAARAGASNPGDSLKEAVKSIVEGLKIEIKMNSQETKRLWKEGQVKLAAGVSVD